jgi:hypothetical protein
MVISCQFIEAKTATARPRKAAELLRKIDSTIVFLF